MAADGKVQIDFSASQQALVAAYEQQSREIDKLSMKLATLEEKSRKGSKETLSLTDQAVGGFAKMAAGVFSVASAMELMAEKVRITRSEYEKLLEKQMRSGQFQMDLGHMTYMLAANMGPDADMTVPQLEAAIRDINKKYGGTRQQVTQAMQGTLSARGAFGVKDTVEQVAQAVRAMPAAPAGELNAMASSAMGLRSFKQLADTGMDAEDAVGAFLQLLMVHRTENVQDMAQNVMRGVVGSVEYGASWQETVAAHGAFSQLMQDPSGRVSGHAVKSFEKAMRESVSDMPELQGKNPFEIREWLLTSGDPRAATKLAGLRSQDKMAEWAAKMTPGGALNAEAKALPFLMHFFEKESNISKLYEELKTKVLPPERAGEFIPDYLARAGESPIVRNVRKGMAANVGLEAVLGIEETGEAGVVADKLKQTLEQLGRYGVSGEKPLEGSSYLGLGPLAQFFGGKFGLPVVEAEMMDFEDLLKKMAPEDAYIEILRRRKEEQHRQWFEGAMGQRVVGHEQTEETRAIDEMIDEAISRRDRLRGVPELGGGEGGDFLFGSSPNSGSRISRMESLLEEIARNTSNIDVRVIEDERSMAARRRQPHQQAVRNIPVAGK